jgi:hypothetical protein
MAILARCAQPRPADSRSDGRSVGPRPQCYTLAMWRGAAGVLLVLGCSFCGSHDDSRASGPDGGADGAAAARWQDLYAAYFGPAGQASCSQLPGSCHRASADLGVSPSGFVCGTTSDACWEGMTEGQPGHTSLVPPGVTDATQTPLWAALYKGAPAGGAASNNMPQNLTYTFSASDLAKIQEWIRAGAPND